MNPPAEIGVSMTRSYMIKYELEGSYKSTIAEYIRVGFTTTSPSGFLLGLVSNITKEYMTIMVSNSGKQGGGVGGAECWFEVTGAEVRY